MRRRQYADGEQWPSLPSRTIHVLNKIDLLPKTGVQDDPARYQYMSASALTGEGIAELAAAIGHALVPNPPAARCRRAVYTEAI